MRASRVAAAAALAAGLTGCLDSNITPPEGGTGEGGRIVFSSNMTDNNFEIYRVDADGRNLRRLTTSRDAGDRAPVLSPDGQHIVWEREVATAGGDITAVEIWRMSVDGDDARAVVQNGSFNRAPGWGPAGDIVFQSRITGSDQIFRLAAGATEPVRLTTGGAADQYPRVSPDGSRIVFQSNRTLDFDIYVMDADGSNVRNLTELTGDDRFPSWSPDGARIVWTRFDELTLSFDLYAMTPTGEGAVPVVATPFNELVPSVSPDGKFLVYQTDRSPPHRLYIAPVSGATPGRPLFATNREGTGEDLTPSWGPN